LTLSTNVTEITCSGGLVPSLPGIFIAAAYSRRAATSKYSKNFGKIRTVGPN
jgi:hypothetical protein